MNSTLKKIIIPLLLVVMLPAISYSVYEITSLNETEEMIEEIYVNQLNTVLNSINQYSDLVTASWTSSLSVALENRQYNFTKLSKNELEPFLNLNRSIVQIVFVENLDFQKYSLINAGSETRLEELKNIFQSNNEKIERLFRYIEEGYRKVEPLDSENEKTQFLAVIISHERQPVITILEIDISTFIQETLRPVILEAAGEEFAIYCSSNSNEYKFNFDDTIDSKQPDVKSQFWLLPKYELGILLKGRTLSGLIAERTYTNLIIIIIMNLIIITGVVIIYRTIRKEIKLTQIKSDFVSNVSHELRTPLALISMFAETLEMGRVKSEEKRNEYYQIISHESTRLSRIVNSILSFSKIESGKRTYNFALTDLNALVNRIYDNYQFHLENQGFKFTFEPSNRLSKINADPEALSEAIINLIDNAAKYSNDTKEILLKTYQKNENIILEIRDKGIGISKDDKEKIFDKFFRVSTGLVHNTKGTGLGLTIVKHVLDAHNAEIELESKVNEGSTFRIIFKSVNT